MSDKKTTLPCLINQDWKAVKAETNKKIKQKKELLSHISMKDITERNELIYALVKLVCDELGVSRKSTNRKSKPGWEIRLATQIKKSTTTSKNDMTEEKR